MNARVAAFAKLVCSHDEQGCLKYIDKYDDFYNAIHIDNDVNMLQLACAHILNRVAIALIDKKCDLAYQNKYGLTSIMYASWYGLTNVVSYIIDKSTDITIRTTQDGTSEIMML
ncbi:MAG: hypothetical protein Faunusvirus57_2 [Faunusvirus sp.]|uniref:Ankyrin repeat protein n=1 Tax=Faunusvirus sp. TaxID=2487766 RepID=A0A3G4ZZW3_9VIRU|nr:MAG: hypothetical protein Faunusvirus57_2 [Faunusvirus sp.]